MVYSTVITPSGTQWPPGYSRRRARRAGGAVRSGGDERAVSQEWDRPAAVELGGGADVVGEADIDQLSAAGAVAKRGRDVIGDHPICGRCGVCFGGEILPFVLAAQIDETAGSPLVLNGWSEAAIWPALARGRC